MSMGLKLFRGLGVLGGLCLAELRRGRPVDDTVHHAGARVERGLPRSAAR